MNHPAHTVTVLVERRYRTQLQPAGLISTLRGAGLDVTVVDDDARSLQLLPRCLARTDAVVLRGRSDTILTAARLAAARGLPVLDPADAVAAVRDKEVMTARLLSAGVRIPRTLIGRPDDVIPLVPASLFPVICKPVFGDNGEGIVIVPTASDLRRLHWPHRLILIQRYLPNDGADLKLYVIGDHVDAVRKPSPVTACTTADLGPVAVTDEMRDLAHRCRELFGLSIFGIDTLATGALSGRADTLWVIEVNDFPNFTTVPGASTLLAQHVLHDVPT